MFKDGVPELPGGDGRLSFFKRCVWYAIWGGRFPFGDTDTVKIENIGGKYYFNAVKEKGASQKTSTSNYRGVWDSSVTYAINDMVLIQTGVSAGLYISVADDNISDPATGIDWVQLAPGTTLGSWT